ncbi:MAG: RNA polymerase sigma factor [Myxococcota bacterium]
MITRLQQGDRAAFATLYEWYGDLVYRQAILPRLPNPELAEDCLRETFRAALEKIGSFRIENRSIFFWLRRIAINKAMDMHRRRQRDQRLTDAVGQEPELRPPSPAPDRHLEAEDVRRHVERALDNMNARYARALRLRLLEDRSREECAELMDVTVGNFDVILHRAAKAFRKVYDA